MAEDLLTDNIEASRGRWVTIQGRRVFIGGDRQGEQLGNARSEQLDRARRGEIGGAAKGKSSWEGFGAAEILRLMGKEGLSFAEAKRACEALGLTPAEPTVRRQLGEGKKGISIPDLDDRQRGIFDDVVNKVRGEKPEPAPKPKPEPKKEKEPEKKPEPEKPERTIYTSENSPLLKESSTLTIAQAAAAAGLEKGQIVRLLKEAAFDPKVVDQIAATEHFDSYIESGQKLVGKDAGAVKLFSDEAQKQFDELVARVRGANDLKIKKGANIPPDFENVGSRELIWHAGKRGLNLKQTKELLERVGMGKEWEKVDPDNFAIKLALRIGRGRRIDKDRELTPKQEKAFDEEVLKMTGGKPPTMAKSGRQVREAIEALIEKQHPKIKQIEDRMKEIRAEHKALRKKGEEPRVGHMELHNLQQELSTQSFFARRDIHKELALPEDLRAKVDIAYTGKGKSTHFHKKPELAKQSSDFLSTIISNDYADALNIKAVDPDPKSLDAHRSYYGMDGTIYMADQAGADTYTHEAGHFLEDMHREALKASKDFLEFRTEDEPIKKLNQVVKASGYRDNEVTREDKFINPYIGKDYGGSATEVMSMGLQYLHKDPVELLTKDPGMFEHVVNVARGIHGDPEEHEEQYNRWQKLTVK